MAAAHEVSATVAYAHIFDAPFPFEDVRAKWASHEGEVWIARREQALVGSRLRPERNSMACSCCPLRKAQAQEPPC